MEEDSSGRVVSDIQYTEQSSQMIDVIEFGVTISIDKLESNRKNSRMFYNQRTALNRELICAALAAYVKNKWPFSQIIRCVDVIGCTGIAGLQWRKHIHNNIAVSINDPHEKGLENLRQNAALNKLNVEVVNKDPSVLLHERTFDFIYLDCGTAASHYFDAAFRNLPARGVLSFTATEDPSQQVLSTELALRHYGGVVSRTLYANEFGIRLFIAAMARSAAKYNKGIHVLCSVLTKPSFTVIVVVSRGSESVKDSLNQIRRVVHCKACEDRAFCPQSLYPIDSPASLLSCSCAARFPGRMTVELGPVWSGDIFNDRFLAEMIGESKMLGCTTKLCSLLHQLLLEARCNSVPKSGATLQHDRPVLHETLPAKKMKLKDDSNVKLEDHTTKKKFTNLESEGNLKTKCDNQNENCEYVPVSPEKFKEQVQSKVVAPPFYFNLHHHSPKGPKLLRINKVVEILTKAGFRASRTHFSGESVRTDASLKQLSEVLLKASS